MLKLPTGRIIHSHIFFLFPQLFEYLCSSSSQEAISLLFVEFECKRGEILYLKLKCHYFQFHFIQIYVWKRLSKNLKKIIKEDNDL